MRVLLTALIFSLISCVKFAEEKEDKLILPNMDEIFPFSSADRVELTSYYFRDYRPENDNYKIIDGKLAFDESIIKERVVLSKKQQEEMFKIVNTDICPKEYSVADCYMPEHRITFYDKKNNVIAYLEVCLQCVGSRISPNFTTVPLCKEKMDELKRFFQSVGIKQFSEM